MKKWQKMVLAVMCFNLLFFSIDSKKREAEAFSVTATALVLGGMAVLGAGATILSRSAVGSLGESVANNLGDNLGKYFNMNLVTDTGMLHMSPAVKVAMNNAITQKQSQLKDLKADGTISELYGYRNALSTGIIGSKGDVFRVSFDYVMGTKSYDGIFLSYKRYTYDQEVSKVIVGPNAGSGHFSGLVEITSAIENEMIYIKSRTNDSKDIQRVTNVVVENLSLKAKPEYQEYLQYSSLPVNSDERLTLIDSNLTKSEYTVSANAITEGVTSVGQIEAGIEQITENTVQTNSFLQNIFNAIGKIPTAILTGISNLFGWLQGLLTNIWNAILGLPAGISTSLSGLWVDAGLVWDGIADDVSNMRQTLADSWAQSMDNYRTGIDNINTYLGGKLSDLRSGIEGGLTNLGTLVMSIPTTITSGIDTVGTYIGSIPLSIDKALDTVIGLVVPTDIAITDYTTKMDDLKTDLTGKFEFITVPIKQVKNIFASPKSIYDIKIDVMGQTVYVLPKIYKPYVDVVKNVLTGTAVISTFISIYKRFRPSEVVA